MSEERAERCETCRFWENIFEAIGSPFEEDNDGQGWCHRYPPTNYIPSDYAPIWPHLDKGDWCGEWQPKQGTVLSVEMIDPLTGKQVFDGDAIVMATQ